MNPNDQKETASGSQRGGALKSLLTGAIYVLAFLAAIVVKPSQYLRKASYDKSGFAFGLGILLSIAGSIGTGYFAMQGGASLQWWLGAAVAAPLAIYFYLAPIAYLGLRSWAFKFSEFLWSHVPNIDDSESKGKKWFSVLLTVVVQLIIIAAGIYTLCSIASGIHDRLGWDNIFAWGVGVIGGGIVAFGLGLLLSAGLWQVNMPVVAILSGVALAYFFGFDLSAHLPAFAQRFLGSYQSGIRHTGEVAQVVLWAAYVFPLLHIIISRMFGWVGKYYTKLLDKTYNDSDVDYKGFLCQVLNFVVAGYAGLHAFGYATTFGYGLWLAAPAAAIAVLVSYLLGGAILRRWSNMFVGIVTSLGAGYLAFSHSNAFFHVPFGVYGAITAGVLTAVANGLLIYPLVYQFVKLIANPVLASWLSKPLQQLYKTISSEVFSAASKTYEDETPYASMFLHVVNIAVATAVYFLVRDLISTIHLAGWLALSLPALLTISSYLFIGRLLVAYKTVVIGLLSSIGVGAFVGVEVFAHYNQNWWYAGFSFVGAALAFAFAVFPVCYVVLRAALEAVRASSWLGWAVTGIYNFFFGFVQKFWAEFVRIYKRISLSFAPIWAEVSKTWDEAWVTVKKTWDDAFNGKNKK